MFDNPSKPKSIFEKYESAGKPRPKHPLRILGAACAVLTVGAAWYVFPILKRHDSMLSQSTGVKQSVNALGGRIEQQNSKLAEWSVNQEQLRRQIADLRREMKSRIETAKKQAGQSAAELFHNVQVELGGQIDSVKSKVARLESSRDADQVQIADLQNELTQLRKELAVQTQDLNDRIQASGFGTEQRLASLQASQERGRKDVESINQKLAVRRIDFEVSKGKSMELAPGVSLEISGTDVAYRRVTGWMWVLPDRRTIWLREQGAQEPVVFYSNNDGQKRELVITSVTKSSAVGYLLIPDGPSVGPAGTDSSAAE